MSQAVVQFSSRGCLKFTRIILPTQTSQCSIPIHTDARDYVEVPLPFHSDHTPRHRPASWCQLLPGVVIAISLIRLSGAFLPPSHPCFTQSQCRKLSAASVLMQTREQKAKCKRRQHAVQRQSRFNVAKMDTARGMTTTSTADATPYHN